MPTNVSESESCYQWLSFHRLWGTLPTAVLKEISQSSKLLKFQPQSCIYQRDTPGAGCYLLKWGTVEIFSQSPLGKTHIRYCNAGDSFGYLALAKTAQNHQTTAIALSQSEVWLIPLEKFEKLLQKYPEITSLLNLLLTESFQELQQRLEKEEQRLHGLQNYLPQVDPQATLIGESKATQKLRSQIPLIAPDLKPVILIGAPGTGKTLIASLIHTHSPIKDYPFAEIDCAQLNHQTDSLFGKDETPGLIELQERGTLLIDNVHLLRDSELDRLWEYLKTGLIMPNPGSLNQSRPSWVRLILATPQPIRNIPIPVHQLKLFALSQRQKDIPALANHFLAQACQNAQRPLLELDQADLRRLVSYEYPANVAELKNILQRAVTMTPSGQKVIPESVLWSVESSKNAFRIDLLNQIKWLRPFLLSDWWPERFWLLMMIIFVPVTILGFIGPSERDSNILLNLFWAWWWPFYLLLFPVIGRLWCAVCPFMITAEWLRRLSLWLFPRQQLSWPQTWLNRWGAWLLWGGFVLIYLWEKLWDLPHNPNQSAWLLIVITLGAVICSLIYERRLWCRYLCPIGGMNGMFAKLSMIELRSTQQVCGSQCSSFGCYHGGDSTPVAFPDALPTEGQATQGCPLYSHPAQLKDNRNCVLCMTCLKACPHRSVQLNLRFLAADLMENHQPLAAEVALLLLLLGGVLMHSSRTILGWWGWQDLAIDAEHLGISLVVVTILLAFPAVLTYVAHRLAKLFNPDLPSYLQLVYVYLPLTLAANLAYYVPAMITEAGEFLPVLAQTFGYSGQGLPTVTWSRDVATFLQEVVLILAVVFSIYPLLKISGGSLKKVIPQILVIVGLVILFLILMV